MQTSTKYPVRNRRRASSFSTEKVLIDGMEVQFDERTGLVPVELVDKTWTGNAVRAMSNPTLKYVHYNPQKAVKKGQITFPTEGSRLLHKAFDNGYSEKRDFNTLHNYSDPNITLGMGHWVYSNIVGLMEEIKGNSRAWKEFCQHFIDAFHKKYTADGRNLLWNELISKYNALHGSEKHLGAVKLQDPQNAHESLHNGNRHYSFLPIKHSDIEAFFEATFLNIDWLYAYKGKGKAKKLHDWPLLGEVLKNNPDKWRGYRQTEDKEPRYFENAFNKAFRIQSVAQIQANYFAKKNRANQNSAKNQGIKTVGGIAALCLHNSSTTFKTWRIKKLNSAWKFDELPSALLTQKKVKELIRNGDEEKVKTRLLQDWRAFCVWSAYRVYWKEERHKSNDVRGRNKSAWDSWFKDTWGEIPTKRGDLPTHTGKHMKLGDLI